MNNIKTLAFCALTLAACEQPLEPAQRIDQPRVLGVRVSGELDQATLIPGQPVRTEFLIAGPEGPEAARVAYRWCEAARSERGVPYCATTPWVEDRADANAGALIAVPASLGPGTRLALLGVACIRGEPALADNPLDYRCSSDEAPLRFSFDAWTRDDAAELNPDLTGLSISLGEEAVSLSEASETPACDDATPTLGAGAKHSLKIELGAAALTGKALQLSHFSTRGRLDRQYSFVAEKPPAHVALTWQAPAQTGPVKQYLVVRDGAGGVSWATWNVCVR